MVMEKFDECIIHIGTEKTGTSTLQKFFRTNELNLARNSIFYPKTFGEENHVKLYVYACDSKKKDTQKLVFGLTTPQKVEDFRKKLIEAFREEIKDQNCKRLLISTEFFHSRLTTNEELTFLKDFLDEFTKSYKIIVYLRSQIELATSEYSEMLKDGETRISILPNVDENNLHYNYEKLLQQWEKFFGRNNITPRIFSKNDLLNEDVKKDFINYLGLDWDEFQDVKNQNLSLNAETQLFLLAINPFLPFSIDGKINPNRRGLVRALMQKGTGEGLLPTREEVEKFLKIFSNSNENVQKKWFPDRNELFEININKYPVEPYKVKDYNFAFKIFSDLWSTQLRNKNPLESTKR